MSLRAGVTCLVLAPGAPTAFAGRGTQAHDTVHIDPPPLPESLQATTRIDVSAYVRQKIAAIAAHRTQCPITPERRWDCFGETRAESGRKTRYSLMAVGDIRY